MPDLGTPFFLKSQLDTTAFFNRGASRTYYTFHTWIFISQTSHQATHTFALLWRRQPALEYRTWDGLEDGHGRLSSPARRIAIPWQAFCLTPWTFFFALVNTEWVHFGTLRDSYCVLGRSCMIGAGLYHRKAVIMG